MAEVVPSAVPSLPSAIMATTPDAAEVRMGTIVSRGRKYVGVRIGNAVNATDAAWLSSYQPILGDVVAVSRQGAVWVVLGSLGGTIESNNALVNYSFEDGPAGVLPLGWSLVTTSGSPTFVADLWAFEEFFALDGVQVGALTSSTTATVNTEVVSDPLPVLGGQQWAAAGYYRTWTNYTMSTTAAIQLRLSWYGDATLGSLISTNAAAVQLVSRGMIDWQLLVAQGDVGYTPPIGATVMRVRMAVTSWSAVAGDTIYFDRMIARRL